MAIDGVNTYYADSGSSTGTNGATKELDQEDFLNLLITQLRNQDPMNPLDSADYTAQLAQFTSLEELYTVNENLVSMQEILSNQGEETLLELIGKTVKADDNTMLVTDGSAVSGAYTLDEAADVTISVYDSSGSEIRTLYRYGQDAGEHAIDWDGRNNSGETVDDGIYYYEVAAVDENGSSVEASTYISGEVTGITYEYVVPYLMIGDRLVSTDQSIIEITNPSTDS
jgi:flagellar basal-body rod modification protein FlgD